MQIFVANPQLQTVLFACLLATALLLSVRKARRTEAFPPTLTRELKGFAILTILLGHIGYGLAKDNSFLFPLSIMAGVGVNIFLFLSGFGLAMSAEKGSLTLWQFYRHRFAPILVPLWITLTVLYLCDYFLLQKSYTTATVVGSYLGYFPSALMLTDLNSPLWYLTFLFSYYLAFPFLYRKTRPFLSALALFVFGIAFAFAMRPLVGTTMWLYVVHCTAFPLGIVASQLLKRLPKRPLASFMPAPAVAVLCAALAVGIGYTALHSGVAHWSEQPISVFTTLATVTFFALIPLRFGLFDLLGKYSYEIYLFHWPLLFRYDFLYGHLPPFMATAAYIAVFLALGWVLQRVSALFLAKKAKT